MDPISFVSPTRGAPTMPPGDGTALDSQEGSRPAPPAMSSGAAGTSLCALDSLNPDKQTKKLCSCRRKKSLIGVSRGPRKTRPRPPPTGHRGQLLASETASESRAERTCHPRTSAPRPGSRQPHTGNRMHGHPTCLARDTARERRWTNQELTYHRRVVTTPGEPRAF